MAMHIVLPDPPKLGIGADLQDVPTFERDRLVAMRNISENSHLRVWTLEEQPCTWKTCKVSTNYTELFTVVYIIKQKNHFAARKCNLVSIQIPLCTPPK
jgi:hypothetical protein